MLNESKNPRQHPESNPVFSSDGFSLLETMVAVSIIAIVLVSIYRLHAQTISMNIDAKFYTVAPFLAQEKLAELDLLTSGDLADDSGDFGDDFPGYTWKVFIGDIDTDLVGTVGDDIKQINISVGYNEDEYTYEVRTYRLFRN